MRLPRIIASGTDSGLSMDEVRRDEIAGKFRAVFEADVDEETKAEMVFELDCAMRGDPDIYAAVGRALGSRLKNAIRIYLDLRRKVPTDEQNFIPERFRERPEGPGRKHRKIPVVIGRGDELEG